MTPALPIGISLRAVAATGNHPILLTGFEPWGRILENPSWDVARAAAGELNLSRPGSARAALLPVDFHPARDRLFAALARWRPIHCLCLGLRADVPALHVERRARKPTEFSDTAGPLFLDGVWGWDALERGLRSSGRSVRTSRDAGAFVCESTYWALLEFRRRHGWPHSAAFVHVPKLEPGGERASTAAALAKAVLAHSAANLHM